MLNKSIWFIVACLFCTYCPAFAGDLEDGDRLMQENNFEKALVSYKAACENKVAKGCYQAAKIYIHQKYPKRDSQQALSYNTLACNLGEGLACLEVGLIYNLGIEGINPDMKQASQFFDKACSAGIGAGCYNYAFVYNKGITAKSNRNGAIKLFDKSCSLGHSLGCYYLGVLYESGEGAKPVKYGVGEVPNELGELVNPLYDKSGAYYTEACKIDIESGGCSRLARLIQMNKYVANNEAEIFDLLKKSCSSNNAETCYYLGKIYKNNTGATQQNSQPAVFFKKACDLGYLDACTELK